MNTMMLSNGDALTLIDLLPVGTMLSHDRVITNVNTAFAQIFGYERDQLLGRSLEVLYPTRRDFVDRGEQWREFLSMYGGHCDERLMLRRGDQPIRIRVKGRCKDRKNPYHLVACAFEAIPAATQPPHLSMREHSIVTAMGQGMTSKEIARLLGLSHRTVETYRQRLMTKTGAKNASQLLAMLH
jgi:DNA-binding CsgD family transcriptional regulator